MHGTGRFDYHRNCAIPHHLPQDQSADGMRVIVFPKRTTDITVGKTYDYDSVLTREATYVIDGEKFRVAHAYIIRCISDAEGDTMDEIFHRPEDAPASSLGDTVDPDALAAFKARLST